ncbi:MAG TPA: AI-2E family transporter, partial [Clostridia bacterium]|nr:AI-2E family transporter [Clostridia bacterium]
MEKPQIRWPKMRKLVFLITYTILLFLILFRIEAVSKAVLWFLNVISPLLIGLALAFIFHLPMNFFQTKVFCSWERHKCRMLKKLYKPLTLILAYLSVFLFIAGFSALVLPRIADSVMRLAANFTVYVARFREWLDGVMGSASITPELSALISEVWQQVLLFLQQMLATIVSRAFDFTIGLTTGLLRLLLSLMISGYMLYNKDKLLAQIKRLCAACIGKAKTERACEVLKISTHVFSRFIVGTLTAALALGIMCFIGMRLLNMQYAFFI